MDEIVEVSLQTILGLGAPHLGRVLDCLADQSKEPSLL
jgi:hypothetical protein